MRRPLIVTITVTVSALATIALTGCSLYSSPVSNPTATYSPTNPKDNTMTPNESVNQLVQLADAAGTIIGGSWHLFDGNLNPEGNGAGFEDPTCMLPNGKPGTNYSDAWIGPGVADPEKVITQIQAAWEKLGQKAVLTKPGERPGTGDTYYLSYPGYLSGTEADGFYLDLEIDTKHSGFMAQTHCVPMPKSLPPSPSDSPDAATSSDITTPDSSDIESVSPRGVPVLADPIERVAKYAEAITAGIDPGTVPGITPTPEPRNDTNTPTTSESKNKTPKFTHPFPTLEEIAEPTSTPLVHDLTIKPDGTKYRGFQ